MMVNRDGQREILERLAALVETLDDDQKRVELLLRKALLAYWTSDFPEARAAASKAVSLSENIGDQSLIRQSYYIQAWALFHLGDTEGSLAHAKTALSMARLAADRLAEGNALNVLGMIRLSQGDFFAAYGYLKDFLAIAHKIGDLTREITALNNYGVSLTRLGDFQAAQEHFQRLLTISQETGDRSSGSTALINLSWVAAAQEEWELARQYAEKGVARKREQEHVEALAEGLVWLGHAWLGLNQPEKSMAAYRELLAIRQKLGQPQLAMGAVAGLARSAVALGDLTSASGYAAEIIAHFADGESLQADWEPLRIYLTCYQVLELAGDPQAEKILKTAFDLLQKQAAMISDPAYRSLFLDNIPWHREIIHAWKLRQTHSSTH